MIVINLLILVFIFFMIWILAFLGHELCHILEANRQGADGGYIIVTSHKGIPSLVCSWYGETSELAIYAGGVYSGIIYLAISILTMFGIYSWGFPLIFSFFTLGIVNIFYGLYEGMYLEDLEYDEYMRYHYIIYIICIISCLIIMWKPLIGYLGL